MAIRFSGRWIVPLVTLLVTLPILVNMGATRARAATAVGLGTADGFAVVGGSTVTNTGSTVLNGDLAVSPGTAITGFPPGAVTPPGTIHGGDAAAAQAQAGALTAYNGLVTQACDSVLTGQDLGTLTLTPGVYCFSSSAQLTGTLTLDGQGNPAAVFIFKIGSTLTTASDSRVQAIGSANTCNIFFQVGSSATLGTSTSFNGSILALTSITLTTGATSHGGLYALNGAVTLDTNVVTAPRCGGTTVPGPSATPSPSPSATFTPVTATIPPTGTTSTTTPAATPAASSTPSAPGATSTPATVQPASPTTGTAVLSPTGTSTTPGPATSTTTPRPPNTGSGGGNRPPLLPWFAIAGFVTIAAAAATLGVRRR